MSQNSSNSSVSFHGPEALAAALAIASGTAAFAAPVRFDNTDGAFDWRPSACGGTNYLDITVAADAQTNTYSDIALSQTYYYGLCNDETKDGNYFYAGSGINLFDNAWVNGGGDYNAIDPLDEGTIIGPSSAWSDFGTTMSVYRSACCESDDWNTVGREAYVGVRLKINGAIHYGWVKARLTNPRAAQLEALAWGYETTPNTPVAAGAGGVDCSADFNGDGQVDFFDFLDFGAAFANEDITADFNSDGQVDFFDYLDFSQAFGTSTC
ncbi:MAG: hypothetical protein SFZ23_14460 [Planctomycetota bacterium]|nr:hypothetical protein [Planctomycetota bacterium]